jgi:hypothetical protein
MSQHRVLGEKHRSIVPVPRRTTLQVLAALLFIAVPTWALVTSGAPFTAAASGVAAAGAATHAASASLNSQRPMVSNLPVSERGLAEAFAAAVTLQGAVVVRDWTTAARELAVLKSVRTVAPKTRLERVRMAIITPLIDRLDATIKAQNQRLANEEAYRLATTLLATLDTHAPVGGGGGMATGLPTTRHTMAVDHIREAASSAAQVQIELLAHDPVAAKANLDQVREQLKAASSGTASPQLKSAIADLDKRRWRVVASLADVPRAYHNNTLLTRGLMRTMQLVGRRAAAIPATPNIPATGTQPGAAPRGGGGGGTLPLLQDVPEPTHAGAPRNRRDKQVSKEATPYAKNLSR